MSVQAIGPDIIRLGLDDAAALFSTPAPGVDLAAMLRQLRAAMAAEASIAGPVPTALRLKILTATGHRLLAGPKTLRSAVHLTMFASAELRDRMALANIRLVALSRLDDGGALTREINRLAAATPLSDAMAQMLLQAAQRQDIVQLIFWPVSHHDLVWGPLRPSLQDKMDDLRNMTPSPAVPEKAIQHLFNATRCGIRDYDTYRARLLTGINLGRYAHYLRTVGAAARDAAGQGKRTTPRAQIVAGLWQRAINDLESPDLPVIMAGLEPGQSLLLLASHAGINAVIGRAINNFGLPRSIIANQPPPDGATDFNVATLAPDVALRFAKLIKLTKKAPRAIFMYPDGGSGDQAKVTILGKTVLIGRGAGTLATFTGAATCFAWTELVEGRIRLRMRPGPRFSGQQDKPAFEAQLTQFYADCLTDIFTGPPEDIGGIVQKMNPTMPLKALSSAIRKIRGAK